MLNPDKKQGHGPWKPRPCPHKWEDLCAILNAWAEEWEEWGEKVQTELNILLPDGGPGKIPDPPEPPFG